MANPEYYKKIYLNIIKAYCEIPLVEKISFDYFEKKNEEQLSKMIMDTVVPGVIRFYGHSMYENRNYLDVINNIIQNLKLSKTHFNEFKRILNEISKKK